MGMDVATYRRTPSERLNLWVGIGVLVVIAVIAAVLLVHHFHHAASPVPYDANTMQVAEDKCDVNHAVNGADVMDCLRGKLPLMSDEQLERIDYWIAQAR